MQIPLTSTTNPTHKHKPTTLMLHNTKIQTQHTLRYALRIHTPCTTHAKPQRHTPTHPPTQQPHTTPPSTMITINRTTSPSNRTTLTSSFHANPTHKYHKPHSQAQTNHTNASQHHNTNTIYTINRTTSPSNNHPNILIQCKSHSQVPQLNPTHKHKPTTLMLHNTEIQTQHTLRMHYVYTLHALHMRNHTATNTHNHTTNTTHINHHTTFYQHMDLPLQTFTPSE